MKSHDHNMLNRTQLVQMYTLFMGGKSYSQIANSLGIRYSTVFGAIKKLKENKGNLSAYRYKTYKRAAAELFGDGRVPSDPEPQVLPVHDAYDDLGKAMDTLKSAIEAVITFEVNRRTEAHKQEFDQLKEVAQKSNWIGSLRTKFGSL